MNEQSPLQNAFSTDDNLFENLSHSSPSNKQSPLQKSEGFFTEDNLLDSLSVLSHASPLKHSPSPKGREDSSPSKGVQKEGKGYITSKSIQRQANASTPSKNIQKEGQVSTPSKLRYSYNASEDDGSDSSIVYNGTDMSMDMTTEQGHLNNINETDIAMDMTIKQDDTEPFFATSNSARVNDYYQQYLAQSRHDLPLELPKDSEEALFTMKKTSRHSVNPPNKLRNYNQQQDDAKDGREPPKDSDESFFTMKKTSRHSVIPSDKVNIRNQQEIEREPPQDSDEAMKKTSRHSVIPSNKLRIHNQVEDEQEDMDMTMQSIPSRKSTASNAVTPRADNHQNAFSDIEKTGGSRKMSRRDSSANFFHSKRQTRNSVIHSARPQFLDNAHEQEVDMDISAVVEDEPIQGGRVDEIDYFSATQRDSIGEFVAGKKTSRMSIIPGGSNVQKIYKEEEVAEEGEESMEMTMPFNSTPGRDSLDPFFAGKKTSRKSIIPMRSRHAEADYLVYETMELVHSTPRSNIPTSRRGQKSNLNLFLHDTDSADVSMMEDYDMSMDLISIVPQKPADKVLSNVKSFSASKNSDIDILTHSEVVTSSNMDLVTSSESALPRSLSQTSSASEATLSGTITRSESLDSTSSESSDIKKRRKSMASVAVGSPLTRSRSKLIDIISLPTTPVALKRSRKSVAGGLFDTPPVFFDDDGLTPKVGKDNGNHDMDSFAIHSGAYQLSPILKENSEFGSPFTSHKDADLLMDEHLSVVDDSFCQETVEKELQFIAIDNLEQFMNLTGVELDNTPDIPPFSPLENDNFNITDAERLKLTLIYDGEIKIYKWVY